MPTPQLSWVRRAAYLAVRYSPLQAWFAWRAADKLAVLAYHRVPDEVIFDAQLAYLARRAHPVSLEEVLAAARKGRVLPHRSVLLTFDDADRTHLDIALPLLRARGIPAVVFVVTGVLDSDLPFWFDEVADLLARGATIPELAGLRADAAITRLTRMPDAARRLLVERLRATGSLPVVDSSQGAAAGLRSDGASKTGRNAPPQLRSDELPLFESAGVAVGNHTLSHACLDRCDDPTARHEILAAHKHLTGVLGHEPLAFAYPGGFFNNRTVELVAEAGYPLAFAYDDRLTAWTPEQPLAISRLRGNAYDPVDRLALTLSGLHGAVWRLVREVTP